MRTRPSKNHPGWYRRGKGRKCVYHNKTLETYATTIAQQIRTSRGKYWLGYVGSGVGPFNSFAEAEAAWVMAYGGEA